jgi:cytochrome c
MGLLGVALAAFAAVQPAAADEALALASGCTACHQLETRLVGPSYKEVAARYKADPGAGQMLEAKVRAGGVGAWGQIPMPANAVVSDADLAAVIDWILAL